MVLNPGAEEGASFIACCGRLPATTKVASTTLTRTITNLITATVWYCRGMPCSSGHALYSLGENCLSKENTENIYIWN